jgi:hypothetical protein
MERRAHMGTSDSRTVWGPRFVQMMPTIQTILPIQCNQTVDALHVSCYDTIGYSGPVADIAGPGRGISGGAEASGRSFRTPLLTWDPVSTGGRN